MRKPELFLEDQLTLAARGEFTQPQYQRLLMDCAESKVANYSRSFADEAISSFLLRLDTKMLSLSLEGYSDPLSRLTFFLESINEFLAESLDETLVNHHFSVVQEVTAELVRLSFDVKCGDLWKLGNQETGRLGLKTSIGRGFMWSEPHYLVTYHGGDQMILLARTDPSFLWVLLTFTSYVLPLHVSFAIRFRQHWGSNVRFVIRGARDGARSALLGVNTVIDSGELGPEDMS